MTQEHEAWLLPPRRLLREKASVPVLLEEVDGLAQAPMTPALGRSEDGTSLVVELDKLPHLAIAGTSGSGKSSLIRTILTSLLTVATPDDLRLLLIDMDAEFDDYRGLPHLEKPPIDDVEESIQALEGLADELERRKSLFQEQNVFNIDDYNSLDVQMPRLLCVIDEFAALVVTAATKKRVVEAVSRIGIRGRKYGIHLILATQIPYADVMLPALRSNLQGRIALKVNDPTASRVALGMSGTHADQLLGNGDALLKDGKGGELVHFQSAWVSRDGLLRVVEHWKKQAPEPVEPEPVPSDPRTLVAPSAPVARRRRSIAGLVATAVAVGGAWLFLHGAATGPPQCPNGTSAENTTQEIICLQPNGQVACTVAANGFVPYPSQETSTATYQSTPPEGGAWCKNAHPWE